MTATSKVLLYDNKFLKNFEEFQMNWLGPFMVVDFWDYGYDKLAQLDGFIKRGWMDVACLNPYNVS